MTSLHDLHPAVMATFLCLLYAAAWNDVRSYRIPNAVVAALIALYPLHLLTSPVDVPFAWAPAVAAAVFLVGTALFATGAMGGGDVKLMAAVALWAGPALVADFVLVTALAGGILGVAALVGRSPRFAATCDAIGLANVRSAGTTVLPYGVAIAAGGGAVGLSLLGLLG